MSALPTRIVEFVKRLVKPIILESCEEDIVIKKHLRAIRVIKDDELAKDTKGSSRMSQVMVSKGRDKETNDNKILTRLFKNLTMEVSKLKQ